jgi:DNA polymerase-3 subunit delta
MPAQTLDTVRRALQRGDFSPVYYLHGPEDLLKDEVARAVVERAVDAGLRDFNVDQVSAASLDPESVYALCNTPPLMAERRVVIIREVEAWKRRVKARNTLLACLEHPASDTVLLLLQGSGEEGADPELASRATTVACDALPADRAVRWVVRRAESVGVSFAPGAAEHLVRAVGTELRLLVAELDKLAALSSGAPISEADVAALVGVRSGETAFDWRDAVFDGDAARATRLLSSVLQRSDVTGVRLVTLLGTTLIGIGAVRAAHDRDPRTRLQDYAFQLQRRTRAFGLLTWGEEARRWARWVPAWPVERVRAGVRALVEADTALKNTAVSDERGIVLDLMFRLCGEYAESSR